MYLSLKRGGCEEVYQQKVKIRDVVLCRKQKIFICKNLKKWYYTGHMKKFQEPNSHIHLISRGLLVKGDEIILCRVKDAKWFFLPGGHIEDGESARSALLRELKEEIGESDYKITSFIGACENIFSLEEDLFQHEINIVFKVEVPSDLNVGTKEDHIEFVNVSKHDLKDCKILPATLKEGLLDWVEDEKSFLKEI